MKFIEYTHFYLDLDRTIWNTYDKYGNEIWARQLIYPFVKNSNNEIVDDVMSVCKLDVGVKEYLHELSKQHKFISFLSRGMNLNVSLSMQPSIQLLHEFGLINYFNNSHILIHKNSRKIDYISNSLYSTIFIDDSDEELHLMKSTYNTIHCVNRNSFGTWKDLL